MMAPEFRKPMHKIIGAILLVAGVFLLMQGHDLSRSFFSEVRNIAVGAPPPKVTYFYVAGAICGAVGLVEFFRSEKK